MELDTLCCLPFGEIMRNTNDGKQSGKLKKAGALTSEVVRESTVDETWRLKLVQCRSGVHSEINGADWSGGCA